MFVCLRHCTAQPLTLQSQFWHRFPFQKPGQMQIRSPVATSHSHEPPFLQLAQGLGMQFPSSSGSKQGAHWLWGHDRMSHHQSDSLVSVQDMQRLTNCQSRRCTVLARCRPLRCRQRSRLGIACRTWDPRPWRRRRTRSCWHGDPGPLPKSQCLDRSRYRCCQPCRT